MTVLRLYVTLAYRTMSRKIKSYLLSESVVEGIYNLLTLTTGAEGPPHRLSVRRGRCTHTVSTGGRARYTHSGNKNEMPVMYLTAPSGPPRLQAVRARPRWTKQCHASVSGINHLHDLVTE